MAGRFIGRFFGRTISDGAAFAIGASTSRTLNPILQDVTNEAWSKHPNAPLSPEEAAALDAADQWTASRAQTEAAYSGINTSRYTALRVLTEEGLDIADAFAAWRRGLLTDDGFNDALAKLRIPERWRSVLKRMHDVLLTPQQLASAVERGEISYADAAAEAELQGVTSDRFRIIERLAGLAPSTDQLVALRRRGLIDDTRMRRGFVQGNVRSEWSDVLAQLAAVLLSPAELAQMVVQGVLDQDTAAAAAAQAGISADNFGRLVRLAGNPPGAMQLLDLWNRGAIGEQDVDRGLRQSRLKPEWVDAVKSLRRHIPTVSDVIRFAVKDVFDPAAVQRFGLDDEFPEDVLPLAAQQGVDREQMRWQWAAHWRNVAPTQLFRMRHREVISDQELDLGLKTADYAPWWRDKLKAITYLTPGRIDLRRMYQAGVIDRPRLVRGYLDLGYRQEDAELLARFAGSSGSSTGKDLTAAQLATEYEARYLNATDYTAALEHLGYSAEEAAQLVALGDRKRIARARDQRVNRIHTSYVGHKISLDDARAALDAAEIPAEARDLMLTEWEGERDANVTRLTRAQIKKAYAKSLRPREWAHDLLTDQGMSADEADLYLDQ